MAKTKNLILAFIATLSFLYASIFPYFSYLLSFIVYKNEFSIRGLLNYITSNFEDVFFLLGFVIIAVGILTKFDGIALTASSALLWLGSVISAVTYFIDAVRYNYFKSGFLSEISYILSDFTFPLAYFLMFVVGIWLTILFFKKKDMPKILNVLIFVALAIWCFAFLLLLIPYSIDMIPNFQRYLKDGVIVDFIIMRGAYLVNIFSQLIGFAITAFVLADFRKKTSITE